MTENVIITKVLLNSVVGIAGIVGLVYLGDYLITTRQQINELYESNQVRTENVIGNSEPETFLEVDGVRFYSKIDGQPVRY